MTSKFAVAALLAVCAGVVSAQDDPSKPAAVEKLITDLNSADGPVRTAATRELFARGKEVLPDLKRTKEGAVLVTNGAFGEVSPMIDAFAIASKAKIVNVPKSISLRRCIRALGQ